jgi:hypothetical protein
MLTTARLILNQSLQWIPGLGPYDYQSPGLEPLPEDVERFFPHVKPTPATNSQVPHKGRRDSRFPGVGWLTWDEASLMYNYSRLLRGRNVLEIGCWVGWSTVAWALGGAQMTVVDPVLGGLPQGDSCRDSLRRAGLLDEVRLLPGYSPQSVYPLFEEGLQWNGFFIDGNHEGDGPLLDAKACHSGAAEDCIILFHDAVQPNICQALAWLGENGWECGMHYTSQFIGVAWRGNAAPLDHIPDPAVHWDRLVKSRFPFLADFRRI